MFAVQSEQHNIPILPLFVLEQHNIPILPLNISINEKNQKDEKLIAKPHPRHQKQRAEKQRDQREKQKWGKQATRS